MCNILLSLFRMNDKNKRNSIKLSERKNTVVVFSEVVFLAFQILMLCCLFFLTWRYFWQQVTSWPATNRVTTFEMRWSDLEFVVSPRCFVSVRLSAPFPPPTELLHQPCMFVTQILLFSVRACECVCAFVYVCVPLLHVVVSTAPLRGERTCVSQVRVQWMYHSAVLSDELWVDLKGTDMTFGLLCEGVPISWVTVCDLGSYQQRCSDAFL